MPDSRFTDQPATRSVSELYDLDWEEPETMRPMLDAIKESPIGSEVLLPVYEEDGEVSRVPYVHDGDGLLHRSDTRAANVCFKTGERKAAARG